MYYRRSIKDQRTMSNETGFIITSFSFFIKTGYKVQNKDQTRRTSYKPTTSYKTHLCTNIFENLTKRKKREKEA